jgi:hypothetical protein
VTVWFPGIRRFQLPGMAGQTRTVMSNQAGNGLEHG